MGILQAGILERVAMPSSRGIFPTQGLNLGLTGLINSYNSCIGKRVLYHERHLGSPNFLKAAAKSVRISPCPKGSCLVQKQDDIHGIFKPLKKYLVGNFFFPTALMRYN